jgi:hypothetical protein
MGWKRIDWFDLVQDRNKWLPLVNTAKTLTLINALSELLRSE